MIKKQKKKKNVSYGTMTKRKAKRDKYYKALFLILFFILWEVLGRLNLQYEWIDGRFTPIPTDIIKSAGKFALDGTLATHLFISMRRTVYGYIIGVLAGVILGSMIASYKTAENMLTPILNLFGPIPVIAFLPMIILWFGIGESSKIILIAYAVVMTLCSYVVEGIKNTDSVLIRSASSLSANEWQIFWSVKFPSASPNIFIGMKSALSAAFGGMVAAEMLGASTGLGYLIVLSKNWFRMSDMIMAAICIGLLYTLMNGILTLIENILFKWKKVSNKGAFEN